MLSSLSGFGQPEDAYEGMNLIRGQTSTAGREAPRREWYLWGGDEARQ